jgi:hypothetical protein
MRLERYIARIEHISNISGKARGEEPLAKPRCRWVSNIIIYLSEIIWDGMDWIDMTQDRYVQ